MPATRPIEGLSISKLHPVVGEELHAWCPWAGAWPASVRWEGVDREMGQEAIVIASQPGPRELSADGFHARFQVERAENRGPLPFDASVRSLDELAFPCQDRRYPALAGPWALGCTEGAVDRAVDLRSGALVKLEQAATSPGLAPESLYSSGWSHGTWRLPSARPVDGQIPDSPRSLAPPAFDGEHVAVALDGRISWFQASESKRSMIDAAPVSWYPPALAWPWIAWVDGRERALLDTDIYVLRAGVQHEPSPLAREPGAQRHLAGEERWLGWIDDRGVWIEDMESRERRHYPSDTGFRAGLDLWGPVGCWEDRSRGSIDILCSDGLALADTGDQGWPSREGPWLLYRQAGHPMLATLHSWVIDDDDPRATFTGPRVEGGFRGAHVEGELRYAFRWLDPRPWCVEAWVEGGWQGRGLLEVSEGRVDVAAPGDALRFVLARPARPGDPLCEENHP